MAKQAAAVPTTTLAVDPASSHPLHRQIYDGVRAAILAGRWPAGAHLPATRALAADLGVSRFTVVEAYAQLRAEGYIDGRPGAGTYVATALPPAAAPPPPCAGTPWPRRGGGRAADGGRPDVASRGGGTSWLGRR